MIFFLFIHVPAIPKIVVQKYRNKKKNNCLSTEIHEKSYFFLVLHEVTAFNTSYQ